MSRLRRRGSSNIWLILLLLLVALPVLGAAGVALFVDPNAFKPRIAEAVRAATGRELALRGPISLRLATQPTLRALDVGLSNPAGASRPEIATLGAMEAQLALWPLLHGRVEIVRLVLSQPDILLETDAAGVGNWRMAAPTVAGAVSAPAVVSAPRVAADATAPRFVVDDLRIEDGKIAMRSGAVVRSLGLKSLRASATGLDGPVSVVADIAAEGRMVAISAELGSLKRLFGEAVEPWPAQFVARAGGARLSVSGGIERPMEGRGYRFGIEASVPDLAAFGQAVGFALPPVRDVIVAAKVEDASGTPRMSALSLRGGAADLGGVLPGLVLERGELLAATLDQPIRVEIEGALAGAKLGLSGTIGAATTLQAGSEPYPIDLRATAASAEVTVKGGIANPLAATGIDLAVTLKAGDVAALGRLAGRSLPALRDFAAEARVSERSSAAGGAAGAAVGGGVLLRNLAVSLPQGDLSGELALAAGPRPSLSGQLNGKRLDLDALQAALATPAEAATGASPSGPVTSPAPPRKLSGRLIPDEPIKLTGLESQDVDLRVALAEIRSGGIVYRDLAGRVLLNGGRVSLDPFSAVLPGGRMDARISADLREAEPPVAIALHAPGLALKPLLLAFGLPADVTGTLEIEADVTAVGRSPHALASTLSGRIGLAMTDGDLDNQLLGSTFGEILRVARLPAELLGAGGAGRTRIRCFATRLDVTRGAATVQSMVLDSSRALVTATGALQLGDETLALRMRPMLRTGGPGVVVPVRVGGTFLAPGVNLDAGGTVEGLASSVGGTIAGLARNPLGTLVGAVAGERGGDACGPPIAQARAARPKL